MRVCNPDCSPGESTAETQPQDQPDALSRLAGFFSSFLHRSEVLQEETVDEYVAATDFL
jgi:hypothetical protein